MIYAVLFLLIIAAGLTHGIMDAIKDLRVHLQAHPFRDFWHVMQHIRVAALLAIGYIWRDCWQWDAWATAITAVCGLVVGRFVWDAVYGQGWKWLALDERVKISTGWKWLDRMLGLHW